jgi:hypothetical protein
LAPVQHLLTSENELLNLRGRGRRDTPVELRPTHVKDEDAAATAQA